MQLGFAYWGCRTFLSGVELGIFTELAKGPLDAEALRQRLGLHPRGCHDFFDALVALGMLDRIDGHYVNTPETDVFLDKRKPSYVGGFLEMSSMRLYRIWADLITGLRTGEPQNEAKSGGNFFDVIYQDPTLLKEFARAMTGITARTAKVIAHTFPWSRYRSFADLGAAEGCLAAQLALSHGHLSGIGFDLPPLQHIFEDYVTTFGLADRVSFRGGDFFTDPLPEADVLIYGRVLHDWSLEEKHALLAKAYDALPKGGALLVYETILDDDRRANVFGLLMSLNMLIETRGGRDYTRSECASWMHAVGFRETWAETLLGPDSMVVAIK